MSGFQVLVLTMLDHESLAAHASRRSRRSLLSMSLLCFNELDLILRRSPTGRANARPMTGSVAVSKDGPQYRFVIPGTSGHARISAANGRRRGGATGAPPQARRRSAPAHKTRARRQG